MRSNFGCVALAAQATHRPLGRVAALCLVAHRGVDHGCGYAWSHRIARGWYFLGFAFDRIFLRLCVLHCGFSHLWLPGQATTRVARRVRGCNGFIQRSLGGFARIGASSQFSGIIASGLGTTGDSHRLLAGDRIFLVASQQCARHHIHAVDGPCVQSALRLVDCHHHQSGAFVVSRDGRLVG